MAIFAFGVIFYSLIFVVETLSPTEIRGEVTLFRLFTTAIFTLSFGPVFEELLFRGYLFAGGRVSLRGVWICLSSMFLMLLFYLVSLGVFGIFPLQ